MIVRVEIKSDYESVVKSHEFSAFKISRDECGDKLAELVNESLDAVFGVVFANVALSQAKKDEERVKKKPKKPKY